MRRIIANEWMTLDGIIQAPGLPDEDRDGGFEFGGWHMPYFDDESQAWVLRGIQAAGGFLLGRRTYEFFASYWPHASEGEQAVAEPLNSKPKWVASTSLAEPLAWNTSELLQGDVPKAVAELRDGTGDDIYLIGSSQLLHTLLEHDLVDGFYLMIDPLTLGRGKRLFGDHGPRVEFRLEDGHITSTGAILATYGRA
jgi:dihydrofolate reductase